MGDYLYLPQQSEEHFKAHNKNNLDFIELNPLPFCLICFPIEKQSSRQFQDFWNWFLNKHSAETYTAYTIYYFDQAYFEDDFEGRNNSINQLLYFATFEQQLPDFEYLNHQIHIWIAAHQLTETPLETEEESYQTAPVFDLFSSESEHSTQTGEKTTPHYHYSELDDFERAATANQYDDEYKFQIVGGYLQGSPATWFSQETNAANIEENNTSFTTRFENKFRTLILISKWCMELERRTQGSGKIVTEYAKAIRKLIKHVDSGRNWTEEQKIHFFTKELRTDLLYALWPLLALKDNSTMDMAIELTQRIEDNQRMHLGFTLSVFAPAPVMAPTPQMAATFFAVQTQDPNEQLIDRLTANLAWLLEPLAQAVRDNQQPQRPRFENRFNQPQQPAYQRQQNRGPPVCYKCELTGHFSRDCNNPPLPPPAPRNNNNQNNRPNNNNNVPNQRPNHANINFFGEDPLIEATGENASQPEENLFYAFNLTDDDHDMDELAINTSEPTRKKKKAKIDFVLDPNKALTSAADNNEPPKNKVFKNPPKLELPEIVQKSGPYSVVKDLMETPAQITFGQLMTHPQFRKNLRKSLIPKKKTPKTNKHSHQAGLADNSNVIPLICKVQVAGYFIDLILNSGSSVSVIAKHFLEAIGRKIDEPSTRPMTNVHGDKKKRLGIAKAVPVRINGISIETDMEVSEAKEYTIIVGNEWLKKAKALLDYELCELTIRCGKKPIVVKCCHWTTPPVPKQNQEEKQSDELNNEESDEEEEQEEQEETAELAYTTFTSNGKPLDNFKADKEGIIVNSKLICWPYYNILRRIFERKPGKKAKYSFWWHGLCARCWCNKLLYSPSDECKLCLIYYKDWKPISLIPREELKEVQKSFENEPSEIQSLVVEQKKPSPEERKIDIENLLARNSPVISKEGDTPGHTHMIQHTITTRET
ncbi:hypothetical protein G9A89_009726 [Geosiphon pyriformis]|nr:hypothetical protein G9A89_009726 [Geosiphon pyriformis]